MLSFHWLIITLHITEGVICLVLKLIMMYAYDVQIKAFVSGSLRPRS